MAGCVALALLCACSEKPDDEMQSTAPAAGAAGNNPNATISPPNAAGPGGTTSSTPMRAGDPATLDAGRSWPSCGASFDDDDGGVSPYSDSCAIDERFGVFANPNVDPLAFADGSREHPFATLQLAVATAVNSGKQVFACEGSYEEPLRIGTALSNGLHVYGGLSCSTFTVESQSARSHAHASAGPALVVADTHDVLIERFELESGPGMEPEPGASYVGAMIQNARHVVLRDVLLHAHDGERGKDGAAPPAKAAGNGTVGSNGGDACSARPNLGGAALSNAGCRDQSNTASGSGGDGGQGTGNGGNGTYFGVAQIPGENAAEWSCVQGQGAPYMTQPGFPGQPGRGGRGFGALLATGFIGFGGQNGADGGPGQGGGGGGGAKAPASCPGGTAIGASGGGGGTGGCGGKGGDAGGAGGTSIGLLAMSSSVSVERSEIRYGNGGDGGSGALGQKGGQGAAGGRGGKGQGGSRDACAGADGSSGGDGGNGGGGNGGHAFGVLYSDKAPALVEVTGEQTADSHHGGAPGAGPVADMMDSVGTAGQSSFQFAF